MKQDVYLLNRFRCVQALRNRLDNSNRTKKIVLHHENKIYRPNMGYMINAD